MINILVLIILTQKTDEVLNMTDPDVQVNTRPIFKHEVEEADQINFDKHLLHIGFYIQEKVVNVNEDKPVVIDQKPLPGPSEDNITRFFTKINLSRDFSDDIPFGNCKDLFSDVDHLSAA